MAIATHTLVEDTALSLARAHPPDCSTTNNAPHQLATAAATGMEMRSAETPATARVGVDAGAGVRAGGCGLLLTAAARGQQQRSGCQYRPARMGIMSA
jgi:hypothetical protein